MATDKPMQLGMIGLGRMGANLVRRVMGDGHRCVVYDVSADAVKALETEGATGATSLEDFIAQLEQPRCMWIMVPAAIVQGTLDQLAGLLDEGDIVIDGGNSYYRDDIVRAEQLARKKIHYVDCGTSGGVWGLERGYCLMIGGEPGPVAHLEPIFKTIAPGGSECSRHTPSRPSGRDRTAGIPPLRAERCRPLRQDGPQRRGVRDDGRHRRRAQHHRPRRRRQESLDRGRRRDDAPARSRILSVRDRRGRGGRGVATRVGGGIVARRPHRRRLRPLPDLADFAGRVSDSGEGRWTVEAAIETGVPAAVITAALYERFESRGNGEFTDKILSAMRVGVRRPRRKEGVAMEHELVIVPDATSLATRAASLVAARAGAAVAERGRFTFAVSGGKTPWAMFGELAHEEVPWGAAEIFQVDERVAPDGDPDRNLTHLRQSLGAAPAKVLAMPVEDPDLDGAAAAYSELLPARFDLVHLGLGPDGHTASLVPGDPVLDVSERLVAVTQPYQEHRRMTLTYPALARADEILWLISGEDKREALAKLLAGDTSIPAGRVHARHSTILADSSAT